jgi:hypothetical protein
MHSTDFDISKNADLIQPVRLEFLRRLFDAYNDGVEIEGAIDAEVNAPTLEIIQTRRLAYEEQLELGNVDPDNFGKERPAVAIRQARGLLTGLNDCGLLKNGNRSLFTVDGIEIPREVKAPSAICTSCFKSLQKKNVPKASLVSGSWPGLVPPALKGLSRIEQSMICVYNAITILGRLPSGNIDVQSHRPLPTHLTFYLC